MTFIDAGFWSRELDGWCDKKRVEHDLWYSLADDVNADAMKVLFLAAPNKSNTRELLAAVLYGRALQSVQAVILLSRRGLITDARALARGCLESAIVLGGLAHIENFEKELIDDHHRSRQRTANVLLEAKPLNPGLTDEQREQLRKIFGSIATESQPGGPKSLVLEQVARRAGLESAYNMLYRPLSGDAAHPTIESLTRLVTSGADGEIEGIAFRPTDTDLENTLSAAITSIQIAMEALAQTFQRQDLLAVAVATMSRMQAVKYPE